MQKNTLLILLLSVVFHFSNTQSSVVIGSNTPNPKAVLWLNATSGQGLLLSSLTTSYRTGMALNNSTEKGMLVYDASIEGGLATPSFAGITTRDKIISITVMVDWSGSGSDWIQPNWVNTTDFYFNWLVNTTTDMVIVNQLNNSAVPPQRSNSILNKAIRAYIMYIPQIRDA